MVWTTMPQCDLRERIFYCEIRKSARCQIRKLRLKYLGLLKYFVYFQVGKLNVVAQVNTFFQEKSKPPQNNFLYKNCIIFQQQSGQNQIQVLLSWPVKAPIRPKWNTWLQDFMKSYFLQTVFNYFDWLLTLTSKIRKLVKGLLSFCTTKNSSPLISAITAPEANYYPLWKNN